MKDKDAKTFCDLAAEHLEKMGCKAIDCGEPIALKVEPLDVLLEAVVYYDDSPAPGPTFRSCWVCNSAHEHLKRCEHLICIVCGTEYRLGVAEVGR